MNLQSKPQKMDNLYSLFITNPYFESTYPPGRTFRPSYMTESKSQSSYFYRKTSILNDHIRILRKIIS
jgi:hypothetical protein